MGDDKGIRKNNQRIAQSTANLAIAPSMAISAVIGALVGAGTVIIAIWQIHSADVRSINNQILTLVATITPSQKQSPFEPPQIVQQVVLAEGDADSAQSDVEPSSRRTRPPVERTRPSVEKAIPLEEGARIDNEIAEWRDVLDSAGNDDAAAFDAYISIASLEIEQGQLQSAIRRYDEAIKLQPDNPGVYFNRGTAKNETGDFDAAIGDFDEAIRLAPILVPAYLNRGYSKASLGRFEDAIKDYDKAIELNPKLTIAYKNRSFANAKLGRRQASIDDMKQAARLDPSLHFLLGEEGSDE